MQDDPRPPADAETTEIRETPSTREEVRRTDRRGPGGLGPGSWVAIALIGFVVLLLLIWLLARDGDEDASIQQRDVEVTQTETDGDDADQAEGGDDGGDTTVVQEGDTIVIEPGDDSGGGDSPEARAVAEGGEVIDQRRADGDQAQVDVTVDERPDLEQFNDARFRMPTGTQLAVTFENDTDEAWNAYIEPPSEPADIGVPTLWSKEPFVEANSTREQTFTTPGAAGTFVFRIEDEGGDTIMEATIELEDR